MFRIVATTLTAAALATTACLLVAAWSLHRASVRLSATVSGIRSAEGLELTLLVHNRSVHLFALTGDEKYLRAALDAEALLRRRTSEVQSHAATVREREQVDDVANRVADYLSTRGRVVTEGRPAVELYGEQRGAPDAAYTAMEKLVDLNLAEAEAAEQTAG